MKALKKLEEVREFLIQEGLQLSANVRDGRINSAFNEDEIIKTIEGKFNIQRPKARDWMDFSLEHCGDIIPVNIKVTTMNTADNLNCKLGIYYALTGKFPHFGNIDWGNYFYSLKTNVCENDKDYYFLVINKNDLKDILIASLKTLKEIKPNGNNLPFQANWSENRERVERTYKEAKDFILQTFSKSLKLRASAYESFLQYFGEYKC